MDTPPPENPAGNPGANPLPSGSPGRVCPNCRQAYEKDPQFCPHCGFNLEPIPHHKFVAGSAGMDIFLAILLSLLCLPMIMTMVVPLVLLLVMDKRYVGFRTGLRIGLILYAVLILGALALCGFIIVNANAHH